MPIFPHVRVCSHESDKRIKGFGIVQSLGRLEIPAINISLMLISLISLTEKQGREWLARAGDGGNSCAGTSASLSNLQQIK